MSQLVIKGHRNKQYKLNVVQFRSPMGAEIYSAQTRKMVQHFPIRAGQPDINFTVQFASIEDKHIFQTFVRDHQINAQTASVEDGLATLWWPERNIENWTGYIVDYRVQEQRFVYAPKATFGVALVESLMSERTALTSRGAGWTSIWGPQIPAYRGPGPNEVDNVIQPPTRPSSAASQDPNTTINTAPASTGR